MGGGDLLNLLIEKDVLDEDFTRFYVAEVGILKCSGKLKLTATDGISYRVLP